MSRANRQRESHANRTCALALPVVGALEERHQPHAGDTYGDDADGRYTLGDDPSERGFSATPMAALASAQPCH
jgi:hypothetical protein